MWPTVRGPRQRWIPRAYLIAVLVLMSALAACSATAQAVRPKSPTATAMTTATPVPNGWNLVASPRVGAEGKLVAVAAHAATDAWAVGQFEGIDSLQRTLTEHWDGSQWSVVASPSPGAAFNILLGVSADAPNDAWAVGYQEAAGANGTNQPLIEHWNGSAWSQAILNGPGLATNSLNCVAAVGPHNIWAVGYYDDIYGTDSMQALIEHYTG